MDARKVAAQFAAYTWYQSRFAGSSSSKDANRFIREKWFEFLPGAQHGLGELLLRLAAKPPSRRSGRRQRVAFAAVG